MNGTQLAGRPSSQIVCKNLYSSIALHGLVPIDAIRATVSAPTAGGPSNRRPILLPRRAEGKAANRLSFW